MKRMSARQRQDAIDTWNDHVPPGTEVAYRDDLGKIKRMKTRARAEMLGGHTPVVWLDGMAGCVALARCSAEIGVDQN